MLYRGSEGKKQQQYSSYFASDTEQHRLPYRLTVSPSESPQTAFLSTHSRPSALPLFLMFSSCLWLFILTNACVFLTSALVYDTLQALFCVLPPPLLVFFPHYYKCHICTMFYLMWAVLLCSSLMNHLIGNTAHSVALIYPRIVFMQDDFCKLLPHLHRMK